MFPRTDGEMKFEMKSNEIKIKNNVFYPTIKFISVFVLV